MEVGLGVTIFLSQTKVDDIDLVSAFANAHQEVVGLDITMDEGFGVDVLDTGDELVGQEEDGLEGEFAVAEVEEILQAGTKEVKYHCVVIALGSEPANKRNANTAG